MDVDMRPSHASSGGDGPINVNVTLRSWEPAFGRWPATVPVSTSISTDIGASKVVSTRSSTTKPTVRLTCTELSLAHAPTNSLRRLPEPLRARRRQEALRRKPHRRHITGGSKGGGQIQQVPHTIGGAAGAEAPRPLRGGCSRVDHVHRRQRGLAEGQEFGGIDVPDGKVGYGLDADHKGAA